MKTEDLTNLGLLESEARVYLALLKLGQSSAGKIAKETKLNRNSVYKALHNLLEQGLVSYVIKANTKEYNASNPAQIERLIKEKEKELLNLKNQIPKYKEIFESTKKKVEADIYEGIKGAKTIWESLLDQSDENDEWLILGAPKSAEILGGYFIDFNNRRAKKKVKLKIIYNKEATELIKIRKKQRLTKLKVMPEEYITPASLEVINDNALLVIYGPQIIIFHLKSKEASDSFKAYFNLLWKIAKLAD
ncbi:MAG: helix-turn-helix domain-containing protein [Nanoarchaeota archaeon]|nr:helix-turn-helix domain-containing protein [Nanoarchaeota archaeon]MCK5630876.1 helix-turn-helix domain-containing protein [Nanoarchaeota archaeon]